MNYFSHSFTFKYKLCQKSRLGKSPSLCSTYSIFIQQVTKKREYNGAHFVKSFMMICFYNKYFHWNSFDLIFSCKEKNIQDIYFKDLFKKLMLLVFEVFQTAIESLDLKSYFHVS